MRPSSSSSQDCVKIGKCNYQSSKFVQIQNKPRCWFLERLEVYRILECKEPSSRVMEQIGMSAVFSIICIHFKNTITIQEWNLFTTNEGVAICITRAVQSGSLLFLGYGDWFLTAHDSFFRTHDATPQFQLGRSTGPVPQRSEQLTTYQSSTS